MTESAILISGITAVTSALVFMWRQITEAAKRTAIKLDACEECHRKTQDRIVSLVRELGELKGRQDGIEELASNVLKAVAESRNQS